MMLNGVRKVGSRGKTGGQEKLEIEEEFDLFKLGFVSETAEKGAGELSVVGGDVGELNVCRSLHNSS